MKYILILSLLLFIAGCGVTNPPDSKEIRAGDSMKSALQTLKGWNASEYSFDRYTVIAPLEGESAQQADRRREQYYADNPFTDLPGFQLPNGLVVTLQSSGQILTSITRELPGESKESHRSIDGFVGLRYDGEWHLIPSERADATDSK